MVKREDYTKEGTRRINIKESSEPARRQTKISTTKLKVTHPLLLKTRKTMKNKLGILRPSVEENNQSIRKDCHVSL
ncbi:hypothetical protein H5410_055500 [Solanum commersonii]|uniref:Uncharacterized protein n=1 Tax=Solanum commersonii TaxID=4109 RepID=A0A9J5WKG5_SOLCO|nr:hypothetical protein H5410_055500 [Solanum commersonii]